MTRGRGAAALVALAVLAMGAARPASAQWRSRRAPFAGKDPDFGQFNVPYNGRYTFVRLRYTPFRTGWGGGGGFFGGVNYWWDHDYPRAERHFATIIDELTSIGPNTDGSEILGVEDDDLFKYPIAYLVEPGWWTITPAEAARLRAYLLKGGFLIVDDFAGGQAWLNFERVMRQVLPDANFVQMDPSHPIFNAFYTIESLDDRHPYYDVPSVYFGVFEDNDPHKRLMIIVNYNNDIGESWEWSDTGFIPIDLTNEAYRLGVNYVVYGMTH